MVVGGQAIRRKHEDPRGLGAQPFSVSRIDDDALDDFSFQQVLQVAILGDQDLTGIDVVVKYGGALVKDRWPLGRAHPNFIVQVFFQTKNVVGGQPALSSLRGEDGPSVVGRLSWSARRVVYEDAISSRKDRPNVPVAGDLHVAEQEVLALVPQVHGHSGTVGKHDVKCAADPRVGEPQIACTVKVNASHSRAGSAAH